MTIRYTEAERAAALADGIPEANICTEWDFTLRIRLTRVEVAALARGEMPPRVLDALTTECAEFMPRLDKACVEATPVVAPPRRRRRA